ncbi:MAG: replicative DNA helicase, partial [Anaerolineaceae bacterium]|nr:replicative DNA helicase [Anaerolineaceae bacterium]
MAKRTNQPQSAAPSLEHVPPHSVEAEMSVLGSMMLDRHAVGLALQLVKPEDFYVPSHQLIARTLIALYDKNVPIDFVTVLDALSEHGGAEEVGGGQYLAQLAESVPSAANAEHYAKIVRNKALLRNFISTTGQLISEAFAEDRTTEDFLDHAEQMIFDVTERKESGKAEGIKDIVQAAFEEIEQADREGQTGLKTNFYKLDKLLGGLQKGEMVVMAARPSVGKTSLAMNIVENA